MITAQDIREKTFEKSTFGGYAMNEVDDFLDELANDLTASQKENATLRAKMKVLADKVQEYRENEEAMHLALVSAQKVAKSVETESQEKADALVSGAQAEADAIIADAKAQAAAIVGGIEAQRKAEELRLEKAQAAAADYIQKFRLVLEHESAFLDSLADSDLMRDVIVTPAPAEKPAIAAPAEEAEDEEEVFEADEDEPVEDEEISFVEVEEEAEPSDYLQAFEKAVSDFEDAIPDAEDGDEAPTFRF